MFDCKKCKALESEIQHLRLENLKLVDRLTAIANPTAYGSVYLAERKSNSTIEQDDDDLEI